MTTNSPHIIRNVTLDLQYSGKAGGWAIQEEARRWLDALFLRLESEWDKLVQPENRICMDMLEIEVDVSKATWQEDALQAVADKIMDQLQLQRSVTQQATTPSLKNHKYHFAEIFFHYLAHGYLPWNAGVFSNEQWQENIRMLWENPEPDFILLLRDFLKKGIPDTGRWIQSIPFETMLQAVLKYPNLLDKEHQRIAEDAGNILRENDFPEEDPSFMRALYAYVLQALAEGQSHMTLDMPAPAAKAKETLRRYFQNHVVHSKAFRKLQQQWSGVDEQVETPVAPENLTGITENLSEPIQKPSDGEKHQTREGETDAGIYIHNAGLILIAPFLPVLFERTGLWNAQGWTDRNTAVCLVQFLATGQSGIEEFELVLPKILCGLSPETLVETRSFAPDEKITDETLSLLHSVVEYWKVLKDTSPDGLRGSFLVREGKLYPKDGDWQLTVEQKSYDMLLQSLPWNISMVQLPWMQGMIKTDWIF